MSGILGIWNLDGRPVERSLLRRLSATLAHRGPDGERLWIDGSVGLACQMFRVTPESLTETQPLVDTGGTVVVFDGRLDNREELLQLLSGPEVSAAFSDSELVLAAYKAFGNALPEKLNGDFALAVFDQKRRQLLLARDSIGVRPLYYCRLGQTFLFASEIKAILAHPDMSPRPNEEILAEFVLLGLFGEEPGLTFFEGVHSLRPAHMALVTLQSFVTKRYWDFDVTQQIHLASFEEYAERFRELFFQAVQRRLRSAYPVAVSVSGGLDSSSIFCTAETLRRRNSASHPELNGISYITDDGSLMDERTFVSEIENTYKVQIQRIPWGPPGLLSGSKDEMWYVEGPFLDLMCNNTHSFLRTVGSGDARVLLAGQWGDELLVDLAHFIDLFRDFRFGEVRRNLNEFDKWYSEDDSRSYRRMFRRDLLRSFVPEQLVPLLKKAKSKIVGYKSDCPWYTEPFRQRAFESASRRIRLRTGYPSAHAKSMHQEATARYHILRMETFNKQAAMHGLEMNFPFLDRDLIAFLIAIPGKMQTRNGVPRAILREAMRGVLPEVIAGRRCKADATHAVNDGMGRDYPQMLQDMSSEVKAVEFGYVNEPVMKRDMAALENQISCPTLKVSWNVSGLIGTELWLRTFFGARNREQERNYEYASAESR